MTDTHTGDEPVPGVPESPGATTSPASKPYSGSDAAHLELRLVDAPADEVTAIVVSVAQIDASIGGGWQTLVEPKATVDLLKLQGGTYLGLGVASLPPGRVEQLRLRLVEGGDHHVVTPDGQSHPLTIPSGEQSGIKLVGGFAVPACATGHVTIDFDGKRSLQLVTKGAAGDEWKLRPVVRLKAIVASGECSDGGADASADGGDAASPPAEDPCASVSCADTEACVNGECRTLE